MTILGTGAAQLDILFQISSVRTLVFDFGIDVSAWTFEFYVKTNKGARIKSLSLTSGSGISFVTYSTSQIQVSFSATNTNLNEAEYYYELRRTDVAVPIVNGRAVFSYDAPQGTDQTQSLAFSYSAASVSLSVYSVTTLTDAGILFSDITTNNSSTSKHGFLPKLDGSTSHFLNGNGQWVTLAAIQQKLLYSVEDYGAVHDGKTVNDASMSSNIVTSATANFQSSDVGKLILIAGAGAAGAALKTTITGFISSTQVTTSASASSSVSSKKLDWGTDDTAAIQNGINACVSGGGGTLYFPNGIYIVNGSLYTGGTNPNSQLYFPSSDILPTRVAIKLLGESNVTMAGTYLGGQLATSGVILQSTLISSEVSGTNPCLLSTLTSTTTVTGGQQYNENWNYIFMENMGFRTYTNGGQAHKMGAVNLYKAAKVSTKNCSFLADYSMDLMVSPASSGTFGLIVCAGNDYGPNTVEENFAQGFEYGFLFGEHTSLDSNYSIGNYYGFAVFSGAYAVTGKMLTHGCVTQIYFQGISPLLSIPSIGVRTYVDLFVECEQVGTALWWGQNPTFFTDPNNKATGILKYGGYQPTPYWDTFTNGGWLIRLPWGNVFPKRFSRVGPLSITGGWFAQATHEIVELGPTTQTTGDNTYHHILSCGANQAGTANIITQRMIYNYASPWGVPLYEERGKTDGGVSIGLVEEQFNTNNINLVALSKRPTGYSFGVPIILPQYANDAAADAAAVGGSALKGTVYYNTTTDKIKVKENATWKTVTTS